MGTVIQVSLANQGSGGRPFIHKNQGKLFLSLRSSWVSVSQSEPSGQATHERLKELLYHSGHASQLEQWSRVIHAAASRELLSIRLVVQL